MRLFGDNSKYGLERVELNDKRAVEVKVVGGEGFPCGVAGLIPVISKRKKGGTKTVYAFPTAEGEVDELKASDELAAISDAVELANRLLAQAAELAHCNLGQIFGVSMGIPEEGYGFTRVELVPIDAHNQPSESPVHLHIETSDNPGEEGSLSVVVELDVEGVPVRASITEYNEDDFVVRVNVNVNEKNGKLSVQKVEESHNGNGRLLYKRGWTPKGAAYVAARKNGEEGGERGGRFVRSTGRAVVRDNDRAQRESDDSRDSRSDRRGPRPVDRRNNRTEIPGMKRIDGGTAVRTGTRKAVRGDNDGDYEGNGEYRGGRPFDRETRRRDFDDRDDRRGGGRSHDRGDRSERRGDRDDRRGGRSFDRDDRRGGKSGNRGDYRGGKSFERDDRRDDSRSYDRGGRDDRRDDSRSYDRDERSGGRSYDRDDYQGGKSYDRGDYQGGKSYDRGDRGSRSFDRNDRKGDSRSSDRGDRRFDSRGGSNGGRSRDKGGRGFNR